MIVGPPTVFNAENIDKYNFFHPTQPGGPGRRPPGTATHSIR